MTDPKATKLKVVLKSCPDFTDEVDAPDNWNDMTDKEKDEHRDFLISTIMENIDAFVVEETDEDYEKY